MHAMTIDVYSTENNSKPIGNHARQGIDYRLQTIVYRTEKEDDGAMHCSLDAAECMIILRHVALQYLLSSKIRHIPGFPIAGDFLSLKMQCIFYNILYLIPRLCTLENIPRRNFVKLFFLCLANISLQSVFCNFIEETNQALNFKIAMLSLVILHHPDS